MRHLPCLLAALLLALPAPVAVAGEAEPPAAADRRAAAEIGRDLLALDEAVRRQALDRLLARIERGGDLAGFLEAMNGATRAWADRHERQMEVWLQEAVHGDAEARERAVRLLTALGPRAIERLAAELRHARLHGRAPRPQGPRRQAAEEKDAEAPTEETAVGIPRAYDLGDLFDRGMNVVALRSLLQKAADAVEVRRFRTTFVVTADDEGHAALRDRLHHLRVTQRLQEHEARQAAADRPPAEAAEAAADDAGRDAPEPPKAAGGETSQRAKPDGHDAPPPADAPGAEPLALDVTPALFQVPAAHAKQIAAASRQATWTRGLPAAPFVATHPAVATADVDRAEAWIAALRRVPDARAGGRLETESRCAPGAACRLFAGRTIRYSRSLTRTEGGAWRIVSDTLRQGLTVEIQARREAGRLQVEVVATRSEVGLPIPVSEVRPAPGATPVELEHPEWSQARCRVTFDLPSEGGSALVGLRGLGRDDEDVAVLVLRLVPATAR